MYVRPYLHKTLVTTFVEFDLKEFTKSSVAVLHGLG